MNRADAYVKWLAFATSEVQFDAPVTSTREAVTQVLVRNGQTIVIGCLREADWATATGKELFAQRIHFLNRRRGEVVVRQARLHHRVEVTGGAEAEHCAKLIREFFAARRV